VYASNEASVKLWTKLGFTNVGCIPDAGRLKKAGGNGEEYVDAWVVHGDFRKIGYKDNEEQGGVGVVASSAS
jgi:L-amino acid N-acyltransferase YncA